MCDMVGECCVDDDATTTATTNVDRDFLYGGGPGGGEFRSARLRPRSSPAGSPRSSATATRAPMRPLEVRASTPRETALALIGSSLAQEICVALSKVIPNSQKTALRLHGKFICRPFPPRSLKLMIVLWNLIVSLWFERDNDKAIQSAIDVLETTRETTSIVLRRFQFLSTWAAADKSSGVIHRFLIF
jgi:hypothetical protein